MRRPPTWETMEQQQRCRGYTKAGKRCTRNVAPSSTNYCAQHEGQAHRVLSLPEVVIYVEPFGAQNLALERFLVPLKAHPWNADEQRWEGTLGTRLAKAPVELDRERAPGWLYFFRDQECSPDYRKIGCTDRPLDVRMEEWRSGHPHLELVQCWHVPFHAQWWETTIHQVLSGVRYMMDRETRTFEPYDHKRRKGKEIEWFSIRDAAGSGGETYLLAICRTVVETLLRQLYGPLGG